MLVRSLGRTATQGQPLKLSLRRYATEAPKSGGPSHRLGYGMGGAALLGGSGYYLYTQGGKPSTYPDEKHSPEKFTPSGRKAFEGNEQGFLSLKLESVEQLNQNTKKFRFLLPESDMVSGLSIASALLTMYKGPEMEKPVLRPYTPTSDEDALGYLDLIVKKYPGGPMSSHMHDMEPGQRLDFKGPLPKYPMSPNKHNHICLIAGGTGITPMWQLARYVFSHPEDKTKVTLVFGNVGEDDILLKREWEDLENKYPQRFRAFYVLNNPPEKWQGGSGFITKELLKTILPEPKEENVKVFVCGPPGLYQAISGPKKSPKDQGELSGILKEMGYSQDQVYKF